MKKIIKKILKNHGEMNSNLGSKTVRDIIAIEIIERLKKKGFYTEYSKEGLKEQEAKKDWVCQTCGKSTFETDYDYLVHPKLHLGCALEEELKGKDIKEQYHEASSKLFKVGKRESMKYSSKGSEYDYRENPSIPYLPGKYTEEELKDKDIKDKNEMSPLDWWKKENPQLKSILNNRIESVEEPEGSPYTPEEIEAWSRAVEDCGTQQPYSPLGIEQYDKYRKKLSEEMIDNKDVKYIYESPDGGETIYRRKFGEYDKRELVKDWDKEKKRIVDGHLIIEDKKSE